MFNISSFLNKLSKNIQSLEIHKNEIIRIIQKHTQIKINLEDLEIKNYSIILKNSPGVKNKVYIYKNKILEEINNTLPTKFVDIR